MLLKTNNYLFWHFQCLKLCAFFGALFFSIQCFTFINSFNSSKIDHFTSQNDFFHYYYSAKHYLNGENPYCASFECDQEGVINTATNPPFLIAVSSWIGYFSQNTGWVIWTLFLTFCSIYSTFLLLKQYSLNLKFGFLLLLWPPVLLSIYYSQVSIVVTLLIVSALPLITSHRNRMAGIAIGFAAALKFYTVPLILFLLFVKKLSGGYAVATVVLLTLSAELIADLSHFDWMRCATPVIKEWAISSAFNQSLFGIVKNFILINYPNVFNNNSIDEIFNLQSIGSAVLISVIIIYIGFRIREDKNSFSWGYGISLIPILAFAPVSWPHYYSLFLLPILGGLAKLHCPRLRLWYVINLFFYAPFYPVYPVALIFGDGVKVPAINFLPYAPTLIFYSILSALFLTSSFQHNKIKV